MERHVHVLLIEDDSKAARRIEQALATAGGGGFTLEHVDGLVPGLDRLADGGVDVCLLDLGLPDSPGPRTVLAARAQAPDVPVLALAPAGEPEIAQLAIEEGAHECIPTDALEPQELAETIRRAVESRAAAGAPTRDLPSHDQAVDGLTSLLNERGLLALGERHVEVAVLTRRPCAVLYVDVDGLAAINDARGMEAGDRALVDVAHLLSETFRGSDVIARVGGDEFCVLLSVVSQSGVGEERAVTRLAAALEEHNASRSGPPISLTVGAARFDPELPAPFASLLVRAKHEMRERKQAAS